MPVLLLAECKPSSHCPDPLPTARARQSLANRPGMPLSGPAVIVHVAGPVVWFSQLCLVMRAFLLR